MSVHSHIKIILHVIWGTHERARILHSELRSKLFEHLKSSISKMKIKSERLNIQPEHLHLLMELPADRAIADIVKQLKGESSNWINENNLIAGKFRWARGYAALSVSVSQMEKVRQYIINQDQHHHRRTFAEEYCVFLDKYGIEYKAETAEAVEGV